MSIYSNQQLQELLGCYVTISLANAETKEGFLYTVDPISGTFILYQPEAFQALMISQHAITSYEFDQSKKIDLGIMDEALHLPSFDDQWLTKRRNAVVNYLTQHRIPFRLVEGKASIQMLDSVYVEPPFVATSIIGDNALIRERVRQLMMEIPL
ncbi:uncharacterized protein BYT42DRAFT_590481 [Radiomyces spectabilis]|uniref:uncharacterized protein n=1 Tax=Radiomyces spectabilis TaxID=64574 RepID=UPI00221FF7B6|nr:uncharacterized protein BYT42DRAFT_590481 [Radiomyces spectabilis]KAI8364800.1 hypothetical protein BYT42DRAFT_590481 [Radiomyces spectabilis]